MPLSILFKRNVNCSINEGTRKDDFNFEWDANQFYDYRAKKWDFEGTTMVQSGQEGKMISRSLGRFKSQAASQRRE